MRKAILVLIFLILFLFMIPGSQAQELHKPHIIHNSEHDGSSIGNPPPHRHPVTDDQATGIGRHYDNFYG